MKARSILSNLLVLAFAGLVANQMACNNASFEAADETSGQRAPAPRGLGNGLDELDNGDTVRCTRNTLGHCDMGADAPTDRVPVRTWDPPEYDVVTHGNKCHTTYFNDISSNSINGIDVWLVVDSSKSFDGEREAVARQLSRGMIASLRHKVPVTVSVIAGHAPSTGAFDGIFSAAPEINPEVFYRHRDEPLNVVFRPNMTPDQLVAAERDLLAKLDDDMRESPISQAKRARARNYEFLPGQFKPAWALGGPHSGSDELGLRNLNDALRYATIPRDNGWIILFASDENDICTPIVENGKAVYSHSTDEPEMENLFCREQQDTPSHIWEDIVAKAAGRPFAVGALIYTGQDTIPAGAHPQASFGKGYSTLAAKGGVTHGVMVDLARKNYEDLDTIARRVVHDLAENINDSVGVHADLSVIGPDGDPLSLNKLRVINGEYDLKVFVDGDEWLYTPDPVNHLIRPFDKGGRPISNARTVRFEYCLK